MTKQIEFELQIGASLSFTFECETDQTGRTHLAHLRTSVGASDVVHSFSTAGGIAVNGAELTLSAGATVTELFNLSEDSAHWVIDVESIGADADDVVRVARGIALVTRDVTRTSDPTPSPSALGFIAYSEPQMLSEPQKAQARSNIGADSGGVTDYNDLTNLPTLGTAAARDVPATGDASSVQVMLGSDSRNVNARAPTAHMHPLSDLDQSGAALGDNPKWNGTAWVPAAGGGMAIGAPVAGAAAYSVPYIDAAGNLAQENDRIKFYSGGSLVVTNLSVSSSFATHLVTSIAYTFPIQDCFFSRIDVNSVALGSGAPEPDALLSLGGIKKKPLTVGTLPVSPVMYDQRLVVDALAPALGSVLVGGGTSPANVIWISPNWIVL